MNASSTANDNCHYTRMTTPGLTKGDAKRRAAVRLASGHIIDLALRWDPIYRVTFSDRDRIVSSIGQHAGEGLYGFDVDFDALFREELAGAYKSARCLQRRQAHRAARGLHARTADYLRRLWKQVERYLARPEVKSVLDDLIREASANGALSPRVELSLLERWHHRRIQVPAFDAASARAAERDRKLLLDGALQAVADLTSLADLKPEARAA